ncbi:MAG: glycosyltransferase family 4 protein [Candidatus Levybacteria bacterium]|nr:glycosyltransferase family 4 protein [Candidatus Levybacteria bacterium]
MKIAIDVSPLQTGHKVRGIGFYVHHLQKALVTYFSENEYLFFTKQHEITEDVDVVHYPYFDLFAQTLPLIKRHKTVVTVHDLTPLIYPEHFPAGFKGKVKWEVQKRNLQRMDMVIANSMTSKKDISKIAGIHESKIAVTYLAAGEEFKVIENAEVKATDLRKKYNLPNKFALYVGDVTWNKNLPNLIRAVNKINIPLVMVGKSLIEKDYDRTNVWSRDRIEVEKLTEGNKNITKLGFISSEELVVLYNAATVFVMPSHYEGFGLPIIEAMQSGCPVVTTHGGSLSEVAGKAAILVDASDIVNIADGIQRLFDNESLQKELRKKGLEQAKKFSWKHTAGQTVDVYRQVLKQI